jgi:hypothetical protein
LSILMGLSATTTSTPATAAFARLLLLDRSNSQAMFRVKMFLKGDNNDRES